MVVIAFLAVAAACVFFLYVLVQFWMEEKHPRRTSDTPMGFPMVSSGQIVMPPEITRARQRSNSARQKTQDEDKNRR
jgi:hypothetical protein